MEGRKERKDLLSPKRDKKEREGKQERNKEELYIYKKKTGERKKERKKERSIWK